MAYIFKDYRYKSKHGRGLKMFFNNCILAEIFYIANCAIIKHLIAKTCKVNSSAWASEMGWHNSSKPVCRTELEAHSQGQCPVDCNS